ncbi:MAG: hypothetical protein AAFY57_11210 [Cyanobacteria bacterium J06642_2]
MNRLVFPFARRDCAIAGALSLSVLVGGVLPGLAQSSANDAAPPEVLQAAVAEAISRANERDLDGVMELYSPNFEHADGLDVEQTREAIARLWDKHDELTYDATIAEWERQGEALEATVVTELQGLQDSPRGDLQLTGTATVRNRYLRDAESGQLKLLDQTVLQESTTLTSGDRPPQFELNVPEAVAMGAEYDLEAVVTQPLGESVLLGAVLADAANVDSYLEDVSFPLQPLQAGGLFRRADAPFKPGSEWISVMLVGDGGITIEGRRLNIMRRDDLPQ